MRYLLRAGFAGWVVVIAWFFLSTALSRRAPELGPMSTFTLFAGLYSTAYLVILLIAYLPTSYIALRSRNASPLAPAIAGALSFAFLFAIGDAIIARRSIDSDTSFGASLFALAGASVAYSLWRSYREEH